MNYDEAVAAGLFDAVAPDAASLRGVAADLIVEDYTRGGQVAHAASRWFAMALIGRPEVAAGVMKASIRFAMNSRAQGAASAVAAAVEAA